MPHPDAEKNQNNKKLMLKFNFPSKKDALSSSQQNSPQQISPLKQSQQVESSHQLVLQPSQPYNSNVQQFGTSQQYPSQSLLGSSQQSEPPLHFGTHQQYPSPNQYVTPQSTNLHYQSTNPNYLPQNQLGSVQKIVTPQQFPTPQHYPSQIQLGSSQQVINPQQQFGPPQQFGLQQYSSQQHLLPQIPAPQQQQLNQTLSNSPQIPLPSVLPLNVQNPLPHIQSQTSPGVHPQTIQSSQSIPSAVFAEVIDPTPSKSVNPLILTTLRPKPSQQRL